MRRPWFVLLAVLGLLSTASQPAAAQKRGDRNTITRQDLDEAGTSISNAYDAVQRLRSNWLNPPRGRMSSAAMIDNNANAANATEAILYIDDRRQAQLDLLRTVPVAKIKEIKYLDQNRAIQMLGPGHEAGAILVTTDKQKP